jgi:hypothetical protein
MISTLVLGQPSEMVRALKQLGLRVIDHKLALRYMAMYYKYVRTIDIEVFRPQANAAATAGKDDDDRGAMPFELDQTLVRLGRVFGMLEGMCKDLDRNFDYFALMPMFWDAFLLDADFMRSRASWDIESMAGSSVDDDV